MKGKQLAYRPDIDGLRAVAVILVLLFHFDLGVRGGFIGVDVFFVISGYLITEVIRNGIIAGKFTFHDFYVRRLLRLHPALLVTLAATLGAGFLIMDPASFSDLASSAKYATFSASNFYFWLNQNYFDASAQTKPLLHTWSLAAEWQFYLAWPFIVWTAMKISDRALPVLLLAMAAASLAASQWMLGKDSSAAYFMMPFRVFELAIGALLVFAPAKRLSGRTESMVAVSGIISIIASSFWLTDQTPFPGLAALLPCLGAAACIYSGQSKAAALLRSKPMVFIGLLSYSIYLVHWPLIVFYKYYIFRDITLTEKLALLAAAIAIGAALYFSVEKLFMAKRKFIKPLGLTAIASACAVAVYACNIVIISGGLKSRIPTEYLSFTSDPKTFHINNYGGHGYPLNAVLGDPKGKQAAVIGGDSFALQYAAGIDAELKPHNRYMSGVFIHGCILSGEYTRVLNNVPRQDCRDRYGEILSLLKGNDLPFVLAQSWDGYRGSVADSSGKLLTSSTDNDYSAILNDMLKRIRDDIGDRKLIIIGTQPYLSLLNSSSSCMLRPHYVPQGCDKFTKYNLEETSAFRTNEVLKNFAKSNANTYYIDSSKSLCSEGVCKTTINNRMIYSDASHLSKDGSIIASKQIINDLSPILN
ncbi:acyltransferase family protein [Pseudomonas taiwanensis]|uniref:acyltransferase family protein n=1 Tax=Pseudomonas taiwanensis TaxID=470150 RepID=UPI0028DF2F0F|nr:acyltransferase family protein [Pseudomonas taiwanensis]MDT8923749.1 acyltransferase family protein [Pseudomonas taiwanensis]